MLKFLNLLGRVSSSLFLGLALAAAPALADSEKFEFQYEKGKPLTYDFTIKMSMAMNNEIDGQVDSTRMDFTMTYRATMTSEGMDANGVSILKYEPSNIGGHWDVDNAAAKVKMTLKDKHMKGTVNGELFMDTKNGKGVEEAKEVQKEIEALYLKGKIAMDDQGRVKKFEGEPEFVVFWQEMMAQQVGLFGIVFPNKELKVGDQWDEMLQITKLEGIKFEGEGLKCDLEFTRLPDVKVGGKELSQFSLSAPFSNKNLKATMDMMGDKEVINIDKMDRTANGKMRFDNERGVLVDGTMEVDAGVVITMDIEGMKMKMNTVIGLDMDMKLVP